MTGPLSYLERQKIRQTWRLRRRARENEGDQASTKMTSLTVVTMGVSLSSSNLLHCPASLMDRLDQTESAVFELCRFTVFPKDLRFRLFCLDNFNIGCSVGCSSVLCAGGRGFNPRVLQNFLKHKPAQEKM